MRISIPLIAFTLSCAAVFSQTQRSASYEKGGYKKAYGAEYLPTGSEDEPCTDARVASYFNDLAARLKPSVITRVREIARSSYTRSLARPSTSASDWLSQLRKDLKTRLESADIGSIQLPVNDLVELALETISDDATKDLREIVDKVEANRLKKERLRERISALRDDFCHFINQKANDKGRRQ